jgi:hypothetical protein
MTTSRERRSRLALVVVAILFAAVAHAATARSSSHVRVSESRQSTVSVLHHADSAIVPITQLVRGGGRALGELLSAPVAGVLAFVALFAAWCTASVRRRARWVQPSATHRRRGPPTLLPTS